MPVSDPFVKKLHEVNRGLGGSLVGCLTLAGFALFGLVALICALLTVVALAFDDGDWWQKAAAALVSGVAALLLWRSMGGATIWSASPEMQGLAALREDQQRSGRISGAGWAASEMQVRVAYALLAVVWLFVILAWNADWASRGTVRAILVTAAILASTFATNALRQVRIHREAGTSTLLVENPPVLSGGELKGRISIGLGVDSPKGITSKLVCQRAKTVGGASSALWGTFGRELRKEITVLWEEEHRPPVASLRREGMSRWSIPVSFALPADARPTDESNPDDKIQWALRVTVQRGDGRSQGDAWEVRVARE